MQNSEQNRFCFLAKRIRSISQDKSLLQRIRDHLEFEQYRGNHTRYSEVLRRCTEAIEQHETNPYLSVRFVVDHLELMACSRGLFNKVRDRLDAKSYRHMLLHSRTGEEPPQEPPAAPPPSDDGQPDTVMIDASVTGEPAAESAPTSQTEEEPEPSAQTPHPDPVPRESTPPQPPVPETPSTSVHGSKLLDRLRKEISCSVHQLSRDLPQGVLYVQAEFLESTRDIVYHFIYQEDTFAVKIRVPPTSDLQKFLSLFEQTATSAAA